MNKFIFLLLIFNSSFSQTELSKKDYEIVNNILNSYRKGENDFISLKETNNSMSEVLRRYYQYRFKDKSTLSIINAENDSVTYASEKEIKEFEKKWYLKFKPLDLIVSKSDMDKIMQKDNWVKWDTLNVKKVLLVKDDTVATKVTRKRNKKNVAGISRPIYLSNEEYALIHFFNREYSTIIILRKDKESWVEKERIML